MDKIYKNNFGEIDDEGVTIEAQHKNKILHEHIIKIKFFKRQKYHLNYMIFFMAIYLIFFVKNHSVSFLNQLLILTFASILIVTSFYIKQFQYKFVLIKKNDFIAFTVTKKLSEDAENLVNQLEKRIALKK